MGAFVFFVLFDITFCDFILCALMRVASLASCMICARLFIMYSELGGMEGARSSCSCLTWSNSSLVSWKRKEVGKRLRLRVMDWLKAEVVVW